MNYPQPDKLPLEQPASNYITVPGYTNSIEVDAHAPDPYTIEINIPNPQTFSATLFPSLIEYTRLVEIVISNDLTIDQKVIFLDPSTILEDNNGLPPGITIAVLKGATSYRTLVHNIQASSSHPKIKSWDLAFVGNFNPDFNDHELAKCYRYADFKMIIQRAFGFEIEHFKTYLSGGIIDYTEYNNSFPILRPHNLLSINVPAKKNVRLKLELFR